VEHIFKIGMVTIGQAPRRDVTADIAPILGEGFQIIERGALDNLSLDYISKNLSPDSDDEVLVSRMKDGSQVRIGKSKILPLIQGKIHELDALGVDLILLLCNDPFPDFKHRSLLIKPEEILHSVAAKLSRTKKIGVMMPDKSQLERIKILWRKYGIEAVAVGVSPYEPVENLSMELEKLKDEDIDLIFMECFGYTLEMKEEVRRITKKPVILTKTLIFKIIHELFK